MGDRALVLGTYRDSELSHTHPLTDTLAALRRQSGVNLIELSGLDDNDVVAFLLDFEGHGIGRLLVPLFVRREATGDAGQRDEAEATR